jgi:hypothetical protein
MTHPRPLREDDMSDEHPIVTALRAGPHCLSELADDLAGCLGDDLKVREAVLRLRDEGHVLIDPDRWPGEYVPGNAMVVRLPGDDAPWPGWDRWNV